MLGILRTLSRGKVEPFVGFHVILWHAISAIKTEAKVTLAIPVALFGRFTEPLHCLHIVLRYACPCPGINVVANGE